jgi:hypothetical protein
MYIRLKGNLIPESVVTAVGKILDRAVLSYRHVAWDQSQRSIVFSIERYNIGAERKFLDKVLPSKLNSPDRVSALVRINNVIACKLENRLNDSNFTRITLLFGLKIENTEFYFSSAEEINGRPVFELTANVSEVDLEITDEGC